MITSSSGKWARFVGDLDLFFGVAVSGDWSEFGFNVFETRKAVNYGCQTRTETGELVSLFPISNIELFTESLKNIISMNIDALRIVSDDAANAELDSFKQKRIKEAEAAAVTPTEDDIYKAQQLLLLTEIYNKLGDSNG